MLAHEYMQSQLKAFDDMVCESRVSLSCESNQIRSPYTLRDALDAALLH